VGIWFSLPGDYLKRLVYTDFYEAHTKLFRPRQHRPCGKGNGHTSLVEGLNNKWRNRVFGVVRKNVCVRYLEDLELRLSARRHPHQRLPLLQPKWPERRHQKLKTGEFEIKLRLF
jgi:hypothetical protein